MRDTLTLSDRAVGWRARAPDKELSIEFVSTHRRLLLLIVCLVLLSAIRLAWRPGQVATRPIEEYPEQFHVPAEGWFFFPFPFSLGWVALPAEGEGEEPFQSQTDYASQGFLASETCGECHAEIYESFVQTPHARTSALPSRETIAGSFDPPANRLVTKTDGFFFEMHERDGRFLQELHIEDGLRHYEHRTPIDLIIGSGEHGQSYLYWRGCRLYLHQVGYFTRLGSWANGPGFWDGTADLSRPVIPACLECHTTYFAHDSQAYNRFDPRHFVLGVGCVRCHGPGTAHVAFHRATPDAVEAQHIVNPGNLPRDRANDVCGHCHLGVEVKEAFQYWPGDDLSKFLHEHNPDQPPPEQSGDPHTANQLAQLKLSRCYQESDLTCFTCHNPHESERRDPDVLANDCRKCHQVTDCGVEPELGQLISTRCVSCHMPTAYEEDFAIEIAQGALTRVLRDHHIRVVPEAYDAVKAELREPPGEEPNPEN